MRRLAAQAIYPTSVSTLVCLITRSIGAHFPRSAAALASECLATIWSIYKIVRTEHFKRDFSRVVTQASCDGIDVLPKYFGYREGIEVRRYSRV